ncbi:aminoacetone oxidase family FAD-binding enzyme [Bacterioplanes sanyensis]|uniref:Aminoacetone oxidase family FAD-binding enzyme n=1 Tax=Bacterioplanes sanyensis TaxID=1249553 RepID=A0A222FJP7_9GAMM|nr:NAD(P)/FAD-dependent oxidoreductase [Bacterioplanes sanyensis]ASP39267.1 aminoacetone oxidase family FAD-binding enzyme [Bacterioplanes sanyensis]
MTFESDVIVLGAGAAGLFCAAQAAARGLSVQVLDHANKAGKKILMSGGGRCNFTNYYIEPSCYISHNPHFCKSALSQYSQWDFIALVEQYGIAYHEKKAGQLFCDDKAKQIVDMLLDQCAQFGAQVRLSVPVSAVEVVEGQYQVQAAEQTFRSRQLVVATGGPSIPTLGASGFGYQLAEQFGLKVYPHRAGLVPFTITDQLKTLCHELSGTALNVTVDCNHTQFHEDMLFTHRGLSGPAMLQISSYWWPGDELQVNLLPAVDVASELRQAQHQRPKQSLKQWLADKTTQRFSEQWWSAVNAPLADTRLAQLNGEQMDNIAAQLHQWRIKPSGTEGYRTAEVALGGVDTDELSSKTLEAKRQPGLYFIGEVVDVTGHLGGFNFQWAWASAYACAQHL